MLLIPAVLVVGGILALVLYLEKASPPYQPFDALQNKFYRDFATHQLIDACMERARNRSPAPCSSAFGMASSVMSMTGARLSWRTRDERRDRAARPFLRRVRARANLRVSKGPDLAAMLARAHYAGSLTGSA